MNNHISQTKIVPSEVSEHRPSAFNRILDAASPIKVMGRQHIVLIESTQQFGV